MIVQDREIEELQQAELLAQSKLLVQRDDETCAKQTVGMHRSWGCWWHRGLRTTPLGTLTVGTSTAFVPFRFQAGLISNTVNSTAVFRSLTVTLTSAASFAGGQLVRFSDPQTRRPIAYARIVSISSNTLTLDKAVMLPAGAIVDSIYPDTAAGGLVKVKAFDNSARIIVGRSGIYDVEASLQCDYSAVLTGTVTMAVFKNGASLESQGLVDIVTLPNAARNHRLATVGLLSLVAGDWLDMRVKKSSSTSASLKYSMARLSVGQIAPGA